MAFTNQRITPADRIFYRLDDAESSKPAGVLLPVDYWVVDEDRHIYLREVSRSARGPESYPDLTEFGYQHHFFANKKTYLLSITKNHSKKVLIKNGTQRYLKEYLSLTKISPMDEYAKSSKFMELLLEALGASEGGNSFIAMVAIENGSTTQYEFELNLMLGD